MATKEVIPGYTYEDPARICWIRLSRRASHEECARKVRVLLDDAGFGTIFNGDGLVALKQHFGEEGNTNFVSPAITAIVAAWIKDNGGIPILVETNTLYKGERSDSARHLNLAYRHGFTMERVGAPVQILDGICGQLQRAVPIPGKHFKTVFMVPDLPFFSSLVVLSHVKGHMLSGMGGALKNLGMGLASRAGKLAQHDDFRPEIDQTLCVRCGLCTTHCPVNALSRSHGSIKLDTSLCIGCGECYAVCRYNAIRFNWAEGDARFQEKMVEHALGAVIDHGGKTVYINFINNLAKQCDCWGDPNPVLYDDVGILASLDPVAIDTASFELTKKILGKDIFKELWPSFDPCIQMKYGEELGLGTRRYSLVEVGG